MKQVWGMILSYLRIWSIPFKNQDWELVDRIEANLIKNMKIFRRWCRSELHFLWLDFNLEYYFLLPLCWLCYWSLCDGAPGGDRWSPCDHRLTARGARWKLFLVLSYSLQSFVLPLLPVMNGVVMVSIWAALLKLLICRTYALDLGLARV
jgi:hypothetical protein